MNVTATLLALVPVWGPWLLLAATFLSCLALPIPASLAMLAGGAFAAGGDLTLSTVVLAALLGAILGDQTGYFVGRLAGRLLGHLAEGHKGRAALIARARAMIALRGPIAIFFTRWLFSPLGPYANLVAGAAGMGWRRFTLAGAAGEAVWVGLYTGLGWFFAGRIVALADLASNVSGALAAGLVAALIGLALLRAVRDT